MPATLCVFLLTESTRLGKPPGRGPDQSIKPRNNLTKEGFACYIEAIFAEAFGGGYARREVRSD